jgi:hypothetical protein
MQRAARGAEAGLAVTKGYGVCDDGGSWDIWDGPFPFLRGSNRGQRPEARPQAMRITVRSAGLAAPSLPGGLQAPGGAGRLKGLN